MHLDSSTLGALRCFEAAARLLSFTQAARSLSLTQSAVSQQIRLLEERLGYRLFVRQARGLELTDKGAVLFETTSRALGDIQATLQRLGLSNSPLQVSCLPSFALQWLMPRLADFHRQETDVLVRLKAEFQGINRQAMHADDIDIAIRYDPSTYSEVQADVLLDEYLVAVATPEYLASHPGFAAGSSLDGITLLHDASPWDGAAEFIEWRTWMQENWSHKMPRLDGPQFNFSSLALAAALNHQGVTMGRTALVHDDILSGRLRIAFGKPIKAPARYVLLSREPDDRRTAIFSRWIQAECQRFGVARQNAFTRLFG
ncbi:LysR family transcriptional regulator [Burkholderia vietnamiensis]|uniref:LysR family transcriptional regulator n=1 Tax=Burkholderia vietnamiensis TaxID=60552 RepID=UPI000757977B|nr:LysR family transcriptional regulator [Burkholderia vietnamiensis]KVF22496.1 LysR family transcriptional regulator [Burkholderia vietnamiensis]KVF66415.1 LysR family transcriptional regulator [Burkholderia vietnamiensis]